MQPSDAADASDPSSKAASSAPDSETVEHVADGGQLLDSMVWDLLPERLQTLLEFLASYPLVLILVVASLGYLLGKLLQVILGFIRARLTHHTKTDFDDQLLTILRKPALTFPVIGSLFLVTAIVPLSETARMITVNVLATLLLFSLLRAALGVSHILLELLASQQDRVDIVETRTLPMFDITSKVVLVAVAGYVALLIWGIDPTAWLASAGVIGIAVGFAARDTLANLFSGIFIVADAPYQMGDYVVLDTGERGEVTHVGLRSTRLLTRDDVEVTIPNAIMANAKIINESGGRWEKFRIRIPVGVAYGSDVDEVTALLDEVAADNPDMLDDPAPRVRMRAFGDSSLDFELLGWVAAPAERGRVTHELLKAIYKRFNAEGVEIPFPQRDVHLFRADNGD